LVIATLITLLISMLVLLPECMPGPLQSECVSSKRLSALIYGITATALIAFAIILRRKESRVASFLAILALMVVPFLMAVAVSR
jgi:hypothetical protein